jgi:hypothetical protein
MSWLRHNSTTAPSLPPAFFNLRVRSLPRANVIVLASLALATLISHAPNLRPTLWLILPFLTMVVGTVDTVRCMRKRWSFYHGGVLLCIYMDLMAITLVLFFLLYPYFATFSETR